MEDRIAYQLIETMERLIEVNKELCIKLKLHRRVIEDNPFLNGQWDKIKNNGKIRNK